MKKLNKLLLILGIIMMIVGAAIMVIYAVLNGGNLYSPGHGSIGETQEVFTIDESFDSINIQSFAYDVVIQPAKGRECIVEAPTGAGLKTECYVERSAKDNKSTLIIVIEDDRSWYDRITLSPFAVMADTDAVVYLPYAEYDELNISTASGEIEVTGMPSFENAVLQGVSGSIECSMTVHEKLSVNTASGSIELEGSAGETEISTASGSIECSMTVHDTLIVNATSGSIELEGSAGKTEISTVSGSVRLEDFDTSSLTVESVSGSLYIPRRLRQVTEFDTVSGSLHFD